ncbi:MAG: methyltransferase, partial [Clostridium sp.]
KEGECNILVKLCTLKDERFSYRKEVTPTSIKAVNAALTVALAKEYMKEEAQVLDPFCGVGTMLIERHKAVKANTMYGIDLQEDAILKARKNTEAARQIIHYINRDFFDFKHEYLFDEIITNMPFKIGRTTEDEIYELYVRFFGKAKEFLNEDGMMILYSHDEEYVRQMAPANGFRIIKTYEISLKEGTYVFVLSGQSSGRQIIK